MVTHRRGHADRWSADNDRWMFFGFFLIGVIFILTLKELVRNQFVVTAVPCALMLAYASLLWDFGTKRPRSGATGDNLYYLGFLYTLTSLGHSLYRFSTDQEDTESIVTNFGIAIFTTILGMALRILLGQTAADDPTVIEASARLDLATSARRLRAEMDYTVQDFKDFRARAGESLAQGLNEAQSGISNTLKRVEALEQAIAHFEGGVRTVAVTIIDRTNELERSAASLTAFERTVERLDGRAEAVVESIEKHSNALASGAASVLESLHSQAERVRAVDFRQTFLEHAVKPAANELRAAASEFAALLDQLRRSDALRERALTNNEMATSKLLEALEESRKLAGAAVDAASASRDVAASLLRVSDQVSQFNSGVKNATGALTGVRDEFSKSSERLRAVNAELTQAAESIASLVKEAERANRRPPRRRWLGRIRLWRRETSEEQGRETQQQTLAPERSVDASRPFSTR